MQNCVLSVSAKQRCNFIYFGGIKIKHIKFALITIIVLILDQITKYWIVQNMYEGQSINLLGRFIRFSYVLNPGAAFGISVGNRFVFLAISIIAVFVIIGYYIHLNHKCNAMIFYLSSILGGAFGNLADRIRLGKVVDFMDIGPWPVFNVADIGVTLGVLGLIFLLIKEERQEEKEDLPNDTDEVNSSSDNGQAESIRPVL